MKINNIILMSMISDLERKTSSANYELTNHCMNKTIIELDGHETPTEKNEKFKEDFDQLITDLEELKKLKLLLVKRNNTVMVDENFTIQEALALITEYRKRRNMYNALLSRKETTERVSETTNSYFKSSTYAFDYEEIKEMKENIESNIEELERAVNRANSLEFELE